MILIQYLIISNALCYNPAYIKPCKNRIKNGQEKDIKKTYKKDAKQVIKKHYWLLIIACIFASFIGAGSSDAMSLLGSRAKPVTSEDRIISTVPSLNASGMIDAILNDSISRFEKEAAAAESQMTKEGIDVPGLFTLSSSKGFFSAIVNKMSSGGVYVLFYTAIRNMTQSDSFANILFIAAALLISFAFFTFVSNVYKAAYMRIFLEA